jgi:hypothetical protein
MPAMTSYRFSWWHQGLFMHDERYDWPGDPISAIDFGAWLAQDPSRALTFVSPCGEMFGSSNAPLRLELLDAEPPIDEAADSVGDFDLMAPSGRVMLVPSGGADDGTITVDVPAGEWRARWSGFGEAAALELAFPEDVLDSPDRPDSYVFQIWPIVTPSPVVVHR